MDISLSKTNFISSICCILKYTQLVCILDFCEFDKMHFHTINIGIVYNYLSLCL